MKGWDILYGNLFPRLRFLVNDFGKGIDLPLFTNVTSGFDFVELE